MTMNIFRLSGDMLHLASILILLLKIRVSKSCAGVSLKTQELYLIVFVCRYGRQLHASHMCPLTASMTTLIVSGMSSDACFRSFHVCAYGLVTPLC